LVLGAIALTSCSTQPPHRPALILQPCTLARDLPAECGTVTVPEDRANPEGRSIAVRVAVLRGDAPGAAVFLLAGGPGQASTSMAPVATGWMQPLRSTMDIVMVDQRGTESAHPLACPADVERDPAGSFGQVLYLDVLRACREAFEGHLDATKYTTEHAAADLDEVRDRFGYGQISLFGGSYGTRLAQAYIRRYPSRVRSAVLDGVVPLDVNVLLMMARSVQQALDRVTRTDSRSAAALTSVLRRFDRGSIEASVTRPDGRAVGVRMSRQDFLYAVRGILYQPAGAAELPALLREAARTGRVDVFAQRYWMRARRMQATIAHGVHLSVDCAEDVPFASEADIERETAGTVMGRWLYDEYARACRLWPSVPAAPDARAPVSAQVPVLLVSGRFDPVTPPDFGERVARSLPRSRHIIAPGGAHGSAAGCARPAVLHVLREGTLDGLPEVCR
jgi:pimeloyl-ACP methyl ester carboxylesterase